MSFFYFFFIFFFGGGGGGGGGHFIQEWNHLCNFYTGHYREHFCENILNLGLLFSWRNFVLFFYF